MPDRKSVIQDVVPYLLLFAAAFLAFANTFGNGWTYDDFPVIVENPDVLSWAGFLADSYPGRPLRELTYLLDHTLFGMNPAGWHVQQIFWHGLNACLVFALGRRLQLARWAALVAALVFLVHPLQVEVVANLSHRKDSLALAGSLGAILCYAKFLAADKRSFGWLAAALACLALGLAAKQSAVVVPLVCLAYEVLMIPPKQRLLARYPALLVGLTVLALGAAAWWWQDVGGWPQLTLQMQDTLSFKANYFAPVTMTVYYLTVLKSWAFMALRLVWPVDLALEYTFPVATGFFDAWILAGLAMLGAACAALVRGYRRWPAGCWVLVAAIGFFLPTANLWPMTYLAADRYLYAPAAFLALGVGFVLTRLPTAYFRMTAVMSVLVLLLLASRTWQQNQVWLSPQTLWTQAYRVSPESSFALNNLGNLALQSGNVERARDFYLRATRVNPLNPTGHFNLGWLAEQQRDLPTAISHYRAFARLDHPVFRQQLQGLRDHLLRSYGVRL